MPLDINKILESEGDERTTLAKKSLLMAQFVIALIDPEAKTNSLLGDDVFTATFSESQDLYKNELPSALDDQQRDLNSAGDSGDAAPSIIVKISRVETQIEFLRDYVSQLQDLVQRAFTDKQWFDSFDQLAISQSTIQIGNLVQPSAHSAAICFAMGVLWAVKKGVEGGEFPIWGDAYPKFTFDVSTLQSSHLEQIRKNMDGFPRYLHFPKTSYH